MTFRDSLSLFDMRPFAIVQWIAHNVGFPVKVTIRSSNMLSNNFAQALLVGFAFLSSIAVPAIANSKPNFIIIFCDDLGYADIGPFGSENHRTPNIDRMASEGIKLTSFYSTCGVCTPSRSSLMTGCYPKRVGMHQNENGQWVLFPGNKRGLNPNEITIAEVLKGQGYATAIVGKWHLGDQPEFLPTRQGFDSYFGIPFSNDMGKIDRPIKMYPATPLLRNETVIEMEPNQRYITRRYTDEALSFIEANKDEPFFLYLPHSMPHWPQYSSEDFSEKSANKAWGDAVEEIDWSTGRIFQRLKELGIDENTLVIFTSDNGGATHHGAVNKPLRGGKGTTWEGGHRVCCVARWPGKIKPETASSAIAVSFDLLPTFAKLAGGSVPADRVIDGKDISPILFGEADESPHEHFYYYFQGTLDAVRQGNWKLFVNGRSRGNQENKQAKPELYNLADDIGESKNVIEANPNVVEKLMAIVALARADLGDGDKYVGKNVREPGHVENARPLTMDPPDELTQTNVFVSGEEGYHTFRIPSLLTTPRGTLLATCEGRKNDRRDHGDLDLVAKRSTDYGKTWSDLQIIHEEGGNKEVTIGNPCPVVDQETGIIWMPFCRDNDDVFMTHSTDDGVTWSKPIDITSSVKKPGWGWYATGPGVGIQMTRGKYNGRLVIPCDHRAMREGEWVRMSHVFYSDDHGESWKLGGSVADYTDECQVAELHDGRLLVNMRNYWGHEGGQPENAKRRATAISVDGGASWRDLGFDSTLIEPICQASLIKHSDDVFRQAPLLFSNPASKETRTGMTVRMSDDQGKTWSALKTIHAGPSAYSCLTVLRDRSIGCLYEAGDKHSYETVRFARFTIPWLKQ
ncbi:MAG: sulfatase-like hydrolase/transferase [Planctomycetales bacterium]|nr:sulfatase-like hydrolase/transferase [Planctomycetales bacterium]